MKVPKGWKKVEISASTRKLIDLVGKRYNEKHGTKLHPDVVFSMEVDRALNHPVASLVLLYRLRSDRSSKLSVADMLPQVVQFRNSAG